MCETAVRRARVPPYGAWQSVDSPFKRGVQECATPVRLQPGPQGDSLRRRFEEEQESHYCSASAAAGLVTSSGSVRQSQADFTRLVCRPLPGPEEPNKNECAASLYIVRGSEICSAGLGGCVVFPGRLRERLQFWEGIGVSSFVLSVIRDGFRLPLVAVPHRKVMSNPYLPTLPVFPVENRKTGPATGLLEILRFLPDFLSARHECTKVRHECTKTRICVGARPETVRKVKAIYVMTASLRSVACDVVESSMR